MTGSTSSTSVVLDIVIFVLFVVCPRILEWTDSEMRRGREYVVARLNWASRLVCRTQSDLDRVVQRVGECKLKRVLYMRVSA